jgi:hypothetical protein
LAGSPARSPQALTIVLLESGRLAPLDQARLTQEHLSAKSPELNRVENIWQFIRDNWLANRIFILYRYVLGHCCFTWNKLIDQPWQITEVGPGFGISGLGGARAVPSW